MMIGVHPLGKQFRAASDRAVLVVFTHPLSVAGAADGGNFIF